MGIAGKLLPPQNRQDEVAGQVHGAGGTSELVVHHGDGIPAIHQAHHGVDKIPAAGPVKPGGAEDVGIGMGFQHQFFPLGLRLPIDSQGCDGHDFRVGSLSGAVKHIVGGNVDHSRPDGACHGCDVPRTGGIQALRKLPLCLRLFHSGVGGAVYHPADAGIGRRKGFQLPPIGDVNISVGSHKGQFRRLQLPGKFAAQHPIFSDKPNHAVSLLP